jgi:hypothetical protein
MVGVAAHELLERVASSACGKRDKLVVAQASGIVCGGARWRVVGRAHLSEP